MAGMANYFDVLLALNALPNGGAPALPPVTSSPIIATNPGPLGPQPAAPSLPPPMPMLPPAAPMPALNPATIGQYQSLAGPAPVAPVTQPASAIEKIAAALGGVSAGLRGQGAEYVSGIREQRERPRREYEARKERYDARRSELGVMGLQAAEREQAAGQKRTQDQADKNFELELNERARQLGFRENVEIEKLRDALLTKRQREEDERKEALRQKEFKAQQERDARNFARDYRRVGAKDTIARELAEYDAGLRTSLSPAAAKWESSNAKLAEARARRAASQGGGAGANAKAQKALAEFQAIKQQVQDAVSRGDVGTEAALRPRMNSAFAALSQFPGVFDLSTDQSGMWPSAALKGSGAAPSAQAGQNINTITLDELRAYMRQEGISDEAEGRRRAAVAGLTVQ